MKKIPIIILTIFSGFCCFAQEIKVVSKHTTYDLIQVPIESSNNRNTWSYITYVRPHYPTGVPKDIYEKLWNYYVKTIERGDYDYDSFNRRNSGDPNWVTPIGEFKDSPSFRFHGVCFQYADYFEFLIRKDPALLNLIQLGILRSESAPSHKFWIYQEPKGVKYYIDPTWGDWTVFGTPQGAFSGWIELERRIEQSAVRHLLSESIMRSWFFVQADAIGSATNSAETKNYERSSHNLK